MGESHTHTSDQQLLDNFYRDKDNYWLGIVLQRYTLLLYGLCMKYLKDEEEAKDAVQQVFLKAITELHRYPVQYLKSWLYMVAKNHCLMKLRDRQAKPSVEIKDQIPAEETGPSSLHTHLHKDRQLELMNESLQELNDEQRRCVTLFYLEKKSYQDVAGLTGFTIMQVKSYIQNGKRNLRLLMEKKTKINDPS